MRTKTGFAELSFDQLRWTCCPDLVPVKSSAEAEPCVEIIGQERALRAIQTGLDIKSLGYNIFITGMVGTGRTTTINQLLGQLEKGDKTPDDILYVNNFKYPDEPVLIMLPAGRGKAFSQEMAQLIDMLRTNIPDLLKSPYYTEKRDSIVESQQKKQRDLLHEFEEEVAEQGFSVIQVQMGLFTRPDLIPVIEGQPIPFAKIESLVKDRKIPKETLETLRERYGKLTSKLEDVFERLKEIDEETRQMLRDWDEESITPVIHGAIDDVRAKFDSPKVAAHLEEVERSLVKSLDVFKGPKKGEEEKEPVDGFAEYRVNLLVDNSDQKGAPVVMETNPNYVNLFGSIESTMTRIGISQTDFTMIKAGSFLKANGGYLVINALDALVEPGVWPTLKRTLRNQIFEIQNYLQMYLFSSARLKPEAVKADVKVVMIGDTSLYNLLYFQDEDFKKIFKIKAEFDSEMPLDDRSFMDYARFIQKICLEDGLLPLDKEGIGALIEYSTRIAGRRTKLSTRFHVIADVIRESSYWAGKAKRAAVGREDVEKAVAERIERVSLIEDKIQEMIEDGTILIDTQGAVVGQVNGLSVYDMGQFMFGKPARITARTGMGRGGVINIEREADLSGPTHNKGVLILGGYLRGKYAVKRPMSLTASLAFEQSYGGVDGDSASSTEVYALLSSLSGLPLRQDLAVTGSLNQRGEIQPIGGVNEKIEGFFDVCRAKGLTGTQGVLIPGQNVRNLMLRADVVTAVKDGRFHIYPVRTIDEGIEILTGVEAGSAGPDGEYTEGTVHGLVDQELQRLAKGMKEFSAPAEENAKGAADRK
ncbi:MAG TPA: ATP-binding protein [Candidatus Aminicenantes bacterium]|nr:ATP-binding protein [Candidatus Aminicenantes bacterium]HRY66068.1 ATP-binding protein [Candidatus Aminicenantes bacterium]HRZ72883.1 ATP-binding protein [Candidatus Aminicenantes bacterium]